MNTATGLPTWNVSVANDGYPVMTAGNRIVLASESGVQPTLNAYEFGDGGQACRCAITTTSALDRG